MGTLGRSWVKAHPYVVDGVFTTVLYLLIVAGGRRHRPDEAFLPMTPTRRCTAPSGTAATGWSGWRPTSSAPRAERVPQRRTVSTALLVAPARAQAVSVTRRSVELLRAVIGKLTRVAPAGANAEPGYAL